jgi:hypothetical protein
VWSPWLVAWIGTAVLFVVAVVLFVAWWHGRGRITRQPPYLSFYLHEQSVMDLYQYKYRGALEQHAVSMVGRRAGVHLGANVAPVRFGGSVERNREDFRRYLEVAEPITVTGLLTEVLEDDMFAVDLDDCPLCPVATWRCAARPRACPSWPATRTSWPVACSRWTAAT